MSRSFSKPEVGKTCRFQKRSLWFHGFVVYGRLVAPNTLAASSTTVAQFRDRLGSTDRINKAQKHRPPPFSCFPQNPERATDIPFSTIPNKQAQERLKDRPLSIRADVVFPFVYVYAFSALTKTLVGCTQTLGRRTERRRLCLAGRLRTVPSTEHVPARRPQGDVGLVPREKNVLRRGSLDISARSKESEPSLSIRTASRCSCNRSSEKPVAFKDTGRFGK